MMKLLIFLIGNKMTSFNTGAGWEEDQSQELFLYSPGNVPEAKEAIIKSINGERRL